MRAVQQVRLFSGYRHLVACRVSWGAGWGGGGGELVLTMACGADRRRARFVDGSRADAPAQRASCRAARLTVVRQQRPCAQGAPQKRSEGRGRVSGGE